MQTLLEVLQKTEAFFAKAGLERPKLEAQQLFAHILDCRRLDLFLRHDEPMTEEQLERLRPMVKRRAQREPLQYIIGHVEFYGLRLKVDARALIPRPETEELVDLLVSRYGDTPPSRVVDLGTGTGAIALALAQAWPQAQVLAIDASRDALTLAQENAKALGLDRVGFRLGSWLEPLRGPVDLIVSNPPYLTEEEMQTAAPEVVDHEPGSALVSGADGLDDLRVILAGAAQRLNSGGLLALETGIDQHATLQKLATAAGLTDFESRPDLSGRDRFVFARKG
ncbi:MAG: peptide chain release factor N(5)-glutamine methyltransferase [Verrucomicrobiota bacterium JB022]|nr:peptide chain release factor N(5)-glutamine methyltransferase [Verrucomicrobiota bacterium JB022]